MSSEPLSMMDHRSKAEQDVHYLRQPRGPGTGWVFRMVTPLELIGQTNPWTGKPFGKEIKKGLQTRHLSEARRRRDIALGQVRELVLRSQGSEQFSIADAEEWRELVREDRSEEQAVGLILQDKLEAAAARGVPEPQLKQFSRVAFGKGYPLSKAADRYIEERAPGNRRGYKPLAQTTVNNLHTALKHLRGFLRDEDQLACLEDVTPALARRFRDIYLPELRSPRSPGGMSHKTVAKNITLLATLWNWALERGITHHRYKSPWVFRKSVPREDESDAGSREDFKADEVSRLLAGADSGTREGDVMRLALVTGCRADEIASLRKEQVSDGLEAFTLTRGKSKNAPRYVPIPDIAKPILRSRLEAHADHPRVFPEWPVRKSVGKVYALSQWFTRYRRQVLGEDTDGTLALHSFRHTWRTVARRARVNETDINELGGWAGQRTSSSIYDHGLLQEQLRASQEQICAELIRSGYLAKF